ncbi:MAG: hypothetical protein ACTH21_11570 [Lactococcus lactis]|uniref:hypothetical protein n=1 Tax=Lactococcus lactis TaxID=1358 RepID=UPI0025A0BB68|nr:hypothetical protein [Lactococcus lactis]MDM7656379.1 hypothetical protein [Lactococcus lactis]
MKDFNQDIQNLLNAYDSNWDDYLALRKQFIEKYSLSVEKLQEIRVEELKDFNSKILQAELKNQKLQEQLNTAKKYIEHLIGTIKHDGHLGTIQTDWILPNLEKALAAIGGDDE